MTQKIFIIFSVNLIASTMHSMDIKFLLNPIPAISSQETASLSQTITISDKKKIICDLCPKKFSFKSSLYYHKRNVHKKHIFYCNIDNCKEYFTYPLAVKTHRKNEHNTIGCICYHYGCTQQYDSGPELSSHTQQMHMLREDIIYHKCHLCEKQYAIKNQLIDHIWTKHEGNFFWCNFGDCNKKFVIRNSVKNHRSKAHEINDYLCFYKGCKESFIDGEKLRIHSTYEHSRV